MAPIPLPASWSKRVFRPETPAMGIRGIAFLAMQIGMNPVASGYTILLGEFVGLVPVALGVEPKTLKG